MSLTAAELALINTSNLSIGNSSAGALTINAPLAFATLDNLTLSSGTSITQSASAPILLQKTLPTTGQRVGTLGAFAGTGTVDLRAANEVPGPPLGAGLAITGSAGSGNFQFTNALPTRLQGVSVSVSGGGTVLISSGLFAPLPLPPPAPPAGGTDNNLQSALLAALDRAIEFPEKAKSESEGDARAVCD